MAEAVRTRIDIDVRGGDEAERAALENAGKEFAQYQRNAGGVKDALESVDKQFLSIADRARNAGEFIDEIGREIQSLPRAEALDLSKALLGDDAGTRMFENIRNGALSMRSLGDEASRAGSLNDELARKADDMRKQIDEAAQVANTKLLVAFQDLGSPIDNLKLSWYSVVGSIGDAITRSEELRQVMQGLLHPIDTIMGAPRVIGNLIAGQAPQDRPIGRLVDMQQRADFDAIKTQWMSAGPKIEFPTIGETRKRFEDRANAEEKEKETSRGRAHGGGRSGLSDASRAEDQYDKITRQLQGQLSLLSSQGDEHDRIKLALDVEKQQLALGAGATDMQKRGVADLVTQIDAATKAQQRYNEEVKAFNDAYGAASRSLSSGLKDIIKGGDVSSALQRSLSTLEDYSLDAALTGTGPFAKMSGLAGKDGATGGLFGGIASVFGLGGDKTTQQMNVNATTVNLLGGLGGGFGNLLGLGSNSNFAGQAAGAIGPFQQSGGFFDSLFSGIGGLFGFADGGVMTGAGALPMSRYASGGIANSPQLAMFGEGRVPEAYIPMTDPRGLHVVVGADGSAHVALPGGRGIPALLSAGGSGRGVSAFADGGVMTGAGALPMSTRSTETSFMSNRDSIDLARSQSRAADSHASAMAVMAGQRFTPAANDSAPQKSEIHIHESPNAKARVQESTDAKGGRRIEVIIDERIARALSSPHGLGAMRSTFGLKPTLPQY